MAREVVRLLTAKTDLGGVYRVDMRLRPEGSRGPMVMGVRSALGYYDTRGRTWERQAYIKARPVAGDLSLGREFLEALTPWIYGRYLSHADISGIKALKRRIEQLSLAGGRGTSRPAAAASATSSSPSSSCNCSTAGTCPKSAPATRSKPSGDWSASAA